MNLFPLVILVVAILAVGASPQSPFRARGSGRREATRVKRQSNDSADKMVQNILQWLQGVYSKTRRTRQNVDRGYLPPINTEKPRPFEPSTARSDNEFSFSGYPLAGSTPQPPFNDGNSISTIFSSSTGFPSSTGPTTIKFPISSGQTPEGTSSVLLIGSTATYQTEGSTGYPSSGGPTPFPAFPTRTPAVDSVGKDTVSTGTVSIPAPDDGDDSKHPPHIHAIDVQCAKDMMTINIEFNREFNGIIYSKGYYHKPECRYVAENSGRVKYTFTVSLNSCGTEFINGFDTLGQSYLENVLVLQNEAGIQEVWDTIRSVRCLWEGNLTKRLEIDLSVGMLQQEIVTFSGDTAMAALDIQLGRGPFAPPANGLVKIGETMTLVISVTGDAGFDLQVKDCHARNKERTQAVQLTDSNGCVLKPKLMGAFQKTRDTGSSGASIMAYAFFSAFKFPDMMDLVLECNVELCKTDCQVCPQPGKLEPGRRRRRDARNDTDAAPLADPVLVGRLLRVIVPEDLSEAAQALLAPAAAAPPPDQLCLSTHGFVLAAALLLCLLACSCLLAGYMWLRQQRAPPKH